MQTCPTGGSAIRSCACAIFACGCFLSVNPVEQTYNVSVVLLRHDGAQEFHPTSGKRLAANDVLAILGAADQISRLAQDNR